MRIIPILLMWPLLAMGLRAQSYDLLLKGGQVIDPANGIDGVRDVAIAGGRIAAVTADIPESSARTVTRGHLSRVTSDKRTGVLLGNIMTGSSNRRSHIRICNSALCAMPRSRPLIATQ